MGIDVVAWVRRHDSSGWLVDVSFSLQVQTTPRHVSHTEKRLPEDLALDGEIPSPRFRILERFALCRHHQRNARGPSCSRVINGAQRDAGVGLERWISAKEDRIAHTEAGKEAPRAGANHSLVVELVGDPHARLDLAPLDVRVMIGNSAEQPSIQTGISLGNTALGRGGKSAPGDDHAIVELSYGRRTGDEAGLGIDRHRNVRIVKLGIEDDHISPQSVVGNDNRITEAEVDGQLLPDLPGILRETLPHVGAEDSVGAVADFGIRIKQPQSNVGGRDSGPSGPAIGEQELAILVVRAGRASLYVDFVIVILAGLLKQGAELQGVITLDPGKAVGQIVDGARGMRPAAEPGEVSHIDGWNAVRDQLSLRKNVRVAEADGGAVKKMSLIDGDAYDVQADGCQDFIHFRWADGPHVVDGVGLVGAIEVFWRFVCTAIERLVLPKSEVHATEAEPLLLGEVDVDSHGILALVLRVLCGEKPVLVAVDGSGEIGSRIGLQDAKPVGAYPGRRNHVPLKASICIQDDGGAVRNDLATLRDQGRLWIRYVSGNLDLCLRGVCRICYRAGYERIVRIEQFAEVTRSHLKRGNGQHASTDGSVRVRENVPDPFLSPVPEDLGLVRIEVVGNVEGAADVVSELVVMNRSCNTAGSRDRIALPRVCIKGCIPDVFIGGAVELLRAALGDDANLATGGPAVFSGVVGGEDLDFLRGVHIRSANAGAVRTRANGGSAVIRDQTLWSARAVDVRWALSEIEVKIRERAAASAGHQVGHKDRVAAIDLQRVNLLPSDVLLHCCRFRLEQDRRRRDLDRLAGGAYAQSRVNDEVCARIELVVRSLVFLETSGLGDHRIEAGRHVRNDVVAGIVRCGLAFDAALVLDGNLSICDRGARRVFDETRNPAKVRLREQDSRSPQAHE